MSSPAGLPARVATFAATAIGTLFTLSAVSVLSEGRSDGDVSVKRTTAAQAIWIQSRSTSTRPSDASRSFVIPTSLRASTGARVRLEGRPAAARTARPGGLVVADLAANPIELMTNLLSYSSEPRYLHFDSTETALLVGQSAGAQLRRWTFTAAITTATTDHDGLAGRLCAFARGLLEGGVLPIFRVDAEADQRALWDCIRSILPSPTGLQLAAADAPPAVVGRWFDDAQRAAAEQSANASVFLVGPNIASAAGNAGLPLRQAVAAIESGAVSVVANRRQGGILLDRLVTRAEEDERLRRRLVAAGAARARLLARIPPAGRPPSLPRRRPRDRQPLRIRLPELGSGRSQATRPGSVSPRDGIRTEKPPPARRGLQLPSIGERKR